VARFALFVGLAIVVICGSPRILPAAQPAETILPNTTKLFVSTLDVEDTRQKFQATQLGAMSQDPLMKPFIEDLRGQIRKKMVAADMALGVSWEDMEGVYGGECVIARIQPDPKNKNSFALAVLIDITGKREKADELLAKIDKQQKLEGAVRRNVEILPGVRGVEYTQKERAGAPRREVDYYFIKDNFLVATDWYPVAKGMAERIGKPTNTDSLATVEAFQYIMKRNADVAAKDGLKFQVRWFAEPFGYLEASRAANKRGESKGQDLLRILQLQGFNAIQGVGGYVFLNTPNDELLHRTYVYAPPVKGAKPEEKFRLAARMLNFPNTKDQLIPQSWAMQGLGTYLTFNWKLQDAFKYSETLIDAIAGEPGVFDDTWASLKNDPQGPGIDIYSGLVEHLGERATIVSDVLQPVNEQSERMLVAIEVKNPKIVAATVNKFFRTDPTATRREFEGYEIWEIEKEQTASADGPMLHIEGTEFVAADAPKKGEDDGEDQRRLPNMAVTVFEGHLVVATHIDYIQDLITNFKAKKVNLEQLEDYKRVTARLVELGQGNDAFRYFAKTEESYRATYEMLRQNKLPQTESMFARLLNAILNPDPEAGDRENVIDGSKLPPYETMVKYLGPTGAFAQSEDNGWWIVGTLQKRDPNQQPESK
jgi:hypothetical protein